MMMYCFDNYFTYFVPVLLLLYYTLRFYFPYLSLLAQPVNIIYSLTVYEGVASLLSPRHGLLTEAKPRSIVGVEGTTNLLFPNTQSISILLYR